MVEEAVHRWAERVVQERREVMRIGYFGSYARGDWGVGSDLDLLIVVEDSDQPFHSRAAKWETDELPVPADVLIYTKDEWQALGQRGRFYQTLLAETAWVYVKEDCGPAEKLRRPSENRGIPC